MFTNRDRQQHSNSNDKSKPIKNMFSKRNSYKNSEPDPKSFTFTNSINESNTITNSFTNSFYHHDMHSPPAFLRFLVQLAEIASNF
jgi:hypothetical protein